MFQRSLSYKQIHSICHICSVYYDLERKENQALRNEIDELKGLVIFLKCSFIRLVLPRLGL